MKHNRKNNRRAERHNVRSLTRAFRNASLMKQDWLTLQDEVTTNQAVADATAIKIREARRSQEGDMS